MKASFCAVVLGSAVLATAAAPDDAPQQAIEKDRQQIAGTWQVVSLVIDGNQAADQDARKLTVVNGTDGTWSLRLEGQEITKGTSTFDPTKKPKTIDFTVTEGESKGESYRGIYELGESTRKMCFAPAGEERPSEFTARPGTQHISVKFERVKPK